MNINWLNSNSTNTKNQNNHKINEITKSTKSPNQRNQPYHKINKINEITKSTKSPNQRNQPYHKINEINEIKIINGPEVMGKADNIKRAKRLKEAKRKREQDALIASGLGPAGKTLQERSTKNGYVTQLNNGKVKYSELLKEFVHPIVNDQDDISSLRTKYTIGAHAWNAATLKEKREEVYQLAKKDFIKIMSDVPEIEELFNEMVKRKQEEFAEFKNIIVDFEIKKHRGVDYELTVATTPQKDL